MNRILFTLTSAALLSSLLSGCGGGGTPAPKTDFTQPSSVEGTIQGFSSGSGTLRLNDSDKKTVASASADSSGTFKLFLPSGAASKNLNQNYSLGLALIALSESNGTCSGSINLSDAAVKTYSFERLELTQGQTKTTLRSGNVQLSKDADGDRTEHSLTSWVYSPAPVTLVGSRTCTSSSVKDGKTVVSTQLYQAGMYLKSGWNTVIARVLSKSGTNPRTEIEVQSVDASKSVWREIKLPDSVAECAPC